MVRDITIGQYYNTRSPIHELDARTKLVLTIVYAVTIFWCRDLWTFLAATAFLIVYVALSRVPLSFIAGDLRLFGRLYYLQHFSVCLTVMEGFWSVSGDFISRPAA